MTKKTDMPEHDKTCSNQVVVKLKNLTNDNDKTMVLPDRHHTIVAALDFFSRNEQVSMSKIDIQISPLVAQHVPPIEQAIAA